MRKVILILVIFLAFFLRVYKLDQYPLGFTWDEAALGYNAYSILKTGKDEYGNVLPLIFKSFGDYKPGLYVYLTIPWILILGLNEFAVRLPSAIFGTLTILIFYLLLREKSIRSFLKIKFGGNSEYSALASLFLLAVSPWHIYFSRGAWELNVMLFEVVFGFFLLLKYLKEKKKIMALSFRIGFDSLFFYLSIGKIISSFITFWFFFFL